MPLTVAEVVWKDRPAESLALWERERLAVVLAWERAVQQVQASS